jgi:hypothetical protein
MRKTSTSEPIFNIAELNKILPSYLLNEVEEDDKDKKNNEEMLLETFSNGNNVSRIIFNINFKLHL